MSHRETGITHEVIYQGKIVNLYRDEVALENGKTAFREVLEHPGGVGILACPDGESVLLVSQYRYPARQELLELPAGKLEPGEDPALCAARELEEETGYRPGKVRELGRFYASPGCSTELLYIYYAEELSFTRQHLDEDEFLSVRKMPLAEACAACRDGRIRDAKTALALLMHQGGL